MNRLILSLALILTSVVANASCDWSAVTCSISYGLGSAIANGAWANQTWMQGFNSSYDSAMSFISQDIARMAGTYNSYSPYYSYYPSYYWYPSYYYYW